MRWAPVSLVDGHHIRHHIENRDIHPNCTPACARFDSKGHPLTKEEWVAWVPHLGHHGRYHAHILPKHCHLITGRPLEDDYHPVLSSHPLPAIPIPHSGGSSWPGHPSDTPLSGPASRQPQASSSSSTGKRLLFIEMPHLDG
jgi:hypothetical protein